jgi:hypothetical protein
MISDYIQRASAIPGKVLRTGHYSGGYPVGHLWWPSPQASPGPHFCLERYRWLTRWELDSVATVARYQKPPSAKQLIILHRLVAWCRNAPPEATIMHPARVDK